MEKKSVDIAEKMPSPKWENLEKNPNSFAAKGFRTRGEQARADVYNTDNYDDYITVLQSKEDKHLSNHELSSLENYELSLLSNGSTEPEPIIAHELGQIAIPELKKDVNIEPEKASEESEIEQIEQMIKQTKDSYAESEESHDSQIVEIIKVRDAQITEIDKIRAENTKKYAEHMAKLSARIEQLISVKNNGSKDDGNPKDDGSKDDEPVVKTESKEDWLDKIEREAKEAREAELAKKEDDSKDDDSKDDGSKDTEPVIKTEPKEDWLDKIEREAKEAREAELASFRNEDLQKILSIDRDLTKRTRISNIFQKGAEKIASVKTSLTVAFSNFKERKKAYFDDKNEKLSEFASKNRTKVLTGAVAFLAVSGALIGYASANIANRSSATEQPKQENKATDSKYKPSEAELEKLLAKYTSTEQDTKPIINREASQIEDGEGLFKTMSELGIAQEKMVNAMNEIANNPSKYPSITPHLFTFEDGSLGFNNPGSLSIEAQNDILSATK